MKQLAKFIIEEIERRHTSIRGLAELLDTTHPTVANVIDGGEPSLRFLVKLSRLTGESLSDLVLLAVPEEVAGENATPTSLAIRFQRLNKDQQEIIDRLITGYVFERPEKDA